MLFKPAVQLLGLFSVLSSTVLAGPLVERNSYTCQKDSLYKKFHEYGYESEVEQFCCAYIHYPTVYVTKHVHSTSVVTKSHSSTKTLTQTRRSTATKLFTETDTFSTTASTTSTIEIDETSTISTTPTITNTATTTQTSEIDVTSTSGLTTTTTFTSTSTEVDTTLTTTTSLPDGAPVGRRNAYYFTQGYKPSQISSACSCLSLTQTLTRTVTDKATSTKSVGVTKSTVKTTSVTSTKSSTTTTSTSGTATSIIDVSSTSTTLTTYTSTETDSATLTDTTSFTSSFTTSVTSSTETDLTTTTTTTSTTFTSTATCEPAPPFFLKVVASTQASDIGQFLQAGNNFQEQSQGSAPFYYLAFEEPNLATATPFILDNSYTLAVTAGTIPGSEDGVTYYGFTQNTGNEYEVILGDLSLYPGYPLVTCSLTASILSCQSASLTETTIENYGGRVFTLDAPNSGSGDTPITLQAVDANGDSILTYPSAEDICPIS